MKAPDEERAGSDLDTAVPSILAAEMCGSPQPGRWTQLLRVLGVRADPWALGIDARSRRKEAVHDTTAEPPSGSPVLAPAWLWALVPLAGWTILLSLWLLFDWRSGGPGPFDYRSATLG